MITLSFVSNLTFNAGQNTQIYSLRQTFNTYNTVFTIRLSPSGSNDSSGIVNDNLHDSAKSDLRVSLVDNGLVGPYSATVLVTLSSAPDHRPPRLASAR
ncbi:hypothetical protein TNCV_3566781 [Trichonephila clavipes]|nr:hypothetical protein TNCV_3566781 [Trichonephila clavipes]